MPVVVLDYLIRSVTIRTTHDDRPAHSPTLKGAGNINIKGAAEKLSRTYARLGMDYSVQAIREAIYRRYQGGPPQDATGQVRTLEGGRGTYPMVTRAAAALLRSAGHEVATATLYAWQKRQVAAGVKPPGSPFELALAFMARTGK